MTTTSFDFHFCSRLFHFAPSSPFFCIVRKMKMFCFSQNVFGTSVTTQMLQTHHCIYHAKGSLCADAGKQQKSIVLFRPSRLNPHPPCLTLVLIITCDVQLSFPRIMHVCCWVKQGCLVANTRVT